MDQVNGEIPLKVLCKYLSYMFSLQLGLQLQRLNSCMFGTTLFKTCQDLCLYGIGLTLISTSLELYCCFMLNHSSTKGFVFIDLSYNFMFIAFYQLISHIT